MKSKKKKVFILIFVVIAAIVLLSFPERIVVGQIKYGNEKCTCTQVSMYNMQVSGPADTKWHCKLCGKTGHSNYTDTPELCELCSKVTGRCEQCGKKLK